MKYVSVPSCARTFRSKISFEQGLRRSNPRPFAGSFRAEPTIGESRLRIRRLFSRIGRKYFSSVASSESRVAASPCVRFLPSFLSQMHDKCTTNARQMHDKCTTNAFSY